MNIEYLKNEGIDVDSALELLGDVEMYNETLQDFYSEVFDRLNKMQEYKNSGDCANYAILAHSMKSDSKYLGFKNLAEVSLQHELKGKENDLDFINNNFDNFTLETNKIINILKNYLGK